MQHVDLVPTILDLVKAPVPGGFRGRSLKPLLEGTGRLPETSVYSEALYARYHFGWSELTALTDDRYRYIKAPREELYDLQRDAGERTNIADERPQARQALRGALDRLAAGATIQAPAEVSADARERLQALGYVGAQTDVSTAPGETLPDPKDKREILERYRAAVDLAGERQVGARRSRCCSRSSATTRRWPTSGASWPSSRRASIAHDLAVDAYKHYIELKPAEPTGYLGAAGGAAQAAQARRRARARRARRRRRAAEADARSRASAHELLAKIALARHDAETARARRPRWRARRIRRCRCRSTSRAAALRPGQVRRGAAALRAGDRRAEESRGTPPIAELHFYAGDTLGRLERYPEAEARVHRGAEALPAERARARRPRDALSGQRPPGRGTKALGDMLRVDADARQLRAGRAVCTRCSATTNEPTRSARTHGGCSP